MKRRFITILVVTILIGTALAPAGLQHSAAQGQPDAWTNIDLNLRSGPAGSYEVLAVLPPDTGLIVEAHDGELIWLLVHTVDGASRGWVASGYLRYREGFAAVRLPASDEIVTAAQQGAPPPAAPASDPPAEPDAPASDDQPDTSASGPVPPVMANAAANGFIESMTLIYENQRSQYYHLVYWSDGLRVTGYIGWPTATGPHPAIIYNRGGAWDAGALTGPELIPLVESGYVAVGSNYRGNAGGDGADTYGADDINDVLRLIDMLWLMPNVDPWRIGMMGGSRGGMMTYLTLKYETLTGQNRVKAAVTVGGLTDLVAWPEQNLGISSEIYMGIFGFMPYQNEQPFIDRSAVYWPELINAPLLILHGEADTTVPVAQAHKLYNAMQQAGKDATLLTFPGDDHPLNGQLNGFPLALEFFSRYLGGDGVNRRYEAHTEDMRVVSEWFANNWN